MSLNKNGTKKPKKLYKRKCQCVNKRAPCMCPHVKYDSDRKKAIAKSIKNISKRKRKYKISRRLLHLSIRPVRYLVCCKNEFERVLTKDFIKHFDDEIEKSKKTVYSKKSRFDYLRLVKLKCIEEEDLIRLRRIKQSKGLKDTKETEETEQEKKIDWNKHKEWLSKNAVAKQYPEEEFEKRKKVPLSELMRYKKLSEPRHPRKKYQYDPRNHFSKSITIVKGGAKNYSASERVESLARPRMQRQKYANLYSFSTGVKESALKYEASDRTDKLAKPRIHAVADSKEDERTKYGVSVKALKYSISEKIIQMSKPKVLPEPNSEAVEFEVEERETTKYGVSVNALKYDASEKITQLARPRELPEPTEPPKFVYVERKETQYGVVENALKYKPSQRILLLSKPIHKQSIEPKEPSKFVYVERKLTKYGVPESALKYKPTERILYLSKPQSSS